MGWVCTLPPQLLRYVTQDKLLSLPVISENNSFCLYYLAIAVQQIAQNLEAEHNKYLLSHTVFKDQKSQVAWLGGPGPVTLKRLQSRCQLGLQSCRSWTGESASKIIHVFGSTHGQGPEISVLYHMGMPSGLSECPQNVATKFSLSQWEWGLDREKVDGGEEEEEERVSEKPRWRPQSFHDCLQSHIITSALFYSLEQVIKTSPDARRGKVDITS